MPLGAPRAAKTENTHSKLAKPELRLLSLSKKPVTISARGNFTVMSTRLDSASPLAFTSMGCQSRSVPRCSKHKSIMALKYPARIESNPGYADVNVGVVPRSKAGAKCEGEKVGRPGKHAREAKVRSEFGARSNFEMYRM